MIDITRKATCPKCHAQSGNDWSQCDGSCPMPMSPYYDPSWRDHLPPLENEDKKKEDPY